MPPISFQDLPLNIYMVIFGTGIFVFMLSLIFCCYFIRLVAGWLMWGGKQRRKETTAWRILSKSSTRVRARAQTQQSFVLEPLVGGCTLARSAGLLRSGVSIYINLSSYTRAHKVTEGWTAFHQLAS